MSVIVQVDPGERAYVDRDGTTHFYGEHDRQGFSISIGGAEIQFKDEHDAVTLAKMILWREGVSYNGDIDGKP